MATKNIRVVGYLPPSIHHQLRQYMEEQSITESTAIVKILKRFFEGTTVDQAAQTIQAQEIAELRVSIQQLQQRLTILEQTVASEPSFRVTNDRTSIHRRPQAVLSPLPCTQLAKRLGVSTNTIEEAFQQGEAYFRDWTRRVDPTKKSWHKRGELFYPESE